MCYSLRVHQQLLKDTGIFPDLSNAIEQRILRCNQQDTFSMAYPAPHRAMNTRCFLGTPFISGRERIPSYVWAVFLILILKVYESAVFKKETMERGAGLKCKTNIPCGCDPKITGLRKSITKSGPPAISRLGLRGVPCTTSECLLHFLLFAWFYVFFCIQLCIKFCFTSS